MPKEISQLVDSLLPRPGEDRGGPGEFPVEVIDQSVYLVDKNNKTKLLVKLVNDKNIPPPWCLPAPSTAPTGWRRI